jgi:hypothetical protein
MTQPRDVTGLLVAWGHGDARADDRLIEAVNAALRGLPRGYSRRVRPGQCGARARAWRFRELRGEAG